MSSTPSDQIVDAPNQSRSSAADHSPSVGSEKKKKKKNEARSAAMKLVAYVFEKLWDMVGAQKTHPAKFSRSQVFDLWCKAFNKTYPSEEEKLRRFKYFNHFLDYVLPSDRPHLRHFSDLSPREASRPDPTRASTEKQRRRLEREAERLEKEQQRSQKIAAKGSRETRQGT